MYIRRPVQHNPFPPFPFSLPVYMLCDPTHVIGTKGLDFRWCLCQTVSFLSNQVNARSVHILEKRPSGCFLGRDKDFYSTWIKGLLFKPAILEFPSYLVQLITATAAASWQLLRWSHLPIASCRLQSLRAGYLYNDLCPACEWNSHYIVLA